jgi:hypothetical protein
MMLCPARAQLKRLQDELTRPAEALVFGSLVHAMIEEKLLDSPVEDRHGMLARIWEEDTDGSDLGAFVILSRQDQLIAEAEEAFGQWLRQVLPFLPSSEGLVERRMCSQIGVHPVDNEAVTMCGTPDVVYPDEHLIVDWKTAGRGWDKQKMESQVQPLAYNVLVYDNVDSSQTYDFVYYVYNRQKGNWKKHDYGKPSLVAIDAFVEQAFGMAVLLYSEPVYTPAGQGRTSRGWHCSPKYCDVWGDCTGRYLVKDGKERQREARLHEKGWN